MRLTHLSQALSALALVFATVLPAAAWQGGQSPPPGGSGGSTPPSSPSPSPSPTTPGRTPTQPTFPTQRDDRQSPMEIRRPIFLSGKVLTAEGVPPPETATIEFVCNGLPRPMAYTDSKGRFSFSLGDNSNTGMMPDASVGSTDIFGNVGSSPNTGMGSTGGIRGVSERDLMNCELRANLPGYQSETLTLAGRRFLDNPDVGTIFIKRLGNVEGFTYSLTTANAPKEARKAYEKGVGQFKKDKFSDAEQSFRKAVAEYPEYAVAWYELGRTLGEQKKEAEAKEAFQKSIEADGKYVRPYLFLMQYEVNAREWEQLEKTTSTIIKLNPFNFPQAWFYNSVANLQMNQLEPAEKSAREALKIDERHKFPKIAHLLGVILAERQQYDEALQHMKSYLTMAPEAGDADAVRKQVGELERFLGAREVGQAPATQGQRPKN